MNIKVLWIVMMLLVMTITQAEASQTIEVDILWIEIAGLSIVLILLTILVVSSLQVTNLKKLHRNLMFKQKEMEKSQNILLTNMSENIHTMATQAVEQTSQNKPKESYAIQDKSTLLDNAEHKLLDVTKDLIDFLRLKSKKVEVVNEAFNLNNVLNEVSGEICSKFMGGKVEFIFDIDTQVPRYLIGDSLHLGQVLTSLLEHLMDQHHLEEVRLEISMFETSKSKVELQFRLLNVGKGIEKEKLRKLFVPYFDEAQGVYIGLGLFVSKELVEMMNGELTVQSDVKRGTTFTLSLPLGLVESLKNDAYILPAEITGSKKIYIVDNSYNSALAIKKMFAYFKYDVKVESKEEFLKTTPNLKEYDIVILNEALFSVKLIEYIKKLQTNRDIKVIALDSLLNSTQNSFVNSIIDVHLFKPLNQERILEMLSELYGVTEDTLLLNKKDSAKKGKVAKTYANYILESKGVNQHSFKDFAGKNILIVEDNLINQKVLTNLLHSSEIHITLANNGQEAVDIVKEAQIHYDMVLMDINMPIMDGYAATQVIRLDNRFDYLPIVAFTALVLDSEINKMFNIGINAFLPKPLNIGRLYTAMKMYLLDDGEIKVSKKEEVSKQKIIKNYEGLNVVKGIAHANNSEALYLEVLKEFLEAYDKSDELFKKLILEHRYEQIKMLCIDMRGLTGTIGADDFHSLVKEILQTLLYKNYEVLPKYTEKYLFELGVLVKSIHAYIEEA